MAAYTKGTQSPALNTSRKKEPLKIGTTVTQFQQPMQSGGQIGGQIGQSFGRMIGGDSGVRRMTAGAGMGGGMPSMGGLEAASMRLADAASAREMRAEEAKFTRERGAQLSDQKRADINAKISQYQAQLDQVRSSPVKNNTEQMLRNKKIQELEDAISGAESDLRNAERKEEYDSLNASISGR